MDPQILWGYSGASEIFANRTGVVYVSKELGMSNSCLTKTDLLLIGGNYEVTTI